MITTRLTTIDMIKFYTTFFLLSFVATSAQTYLEKHAQCSGILKGVEIGSDDFWNKLQQRDNCLIGSQAPDYAVKTIGNEEFDNKSLSGKVVVLNFWSTACAPCVAEIPFLNSMVSKYKSDNIEFIAVANDAPEKLTKFLASRRFDFKVASGDRLLLDTFKLFSAWPTTVIIDAQNNIRYIKLGDLKPDTEKFERTLAELVKR
ncbi:MAG: TlpA family protein disulfide reductase [Proteobacteria bacterium]|nr:MAG: TlpA family protein disulfide reductase [Pseudomonadota bacterium]